MKEQVKCAFCTKDLPANGGNMYCIAVGAAGIESPACLECIKRLKLTIMRLETP